MSEKVTMEKCKIKNRFKFKNTIVVSFTKSGAFACQREYEEAYCYWKIGQAQVSKFFVFTHFPHEALMVVA